MFNRLLSQTEPIYRKDESIGVKKMIIGLQFFVQKQKFKKYIEELWFVKLCFPGFHLDSWTF